MEYEISPRGRRRLSVAACNHLRFVNEVLGVTLTQISQRTGIDIRSLSNYKTEKSLPSAERACELMEYFSNLYSTLLTPLTQYLERRNGRLDLNERAFLRDWHLLKYWAGRIALSNFPEATKIVTAEKDGEHLSTAVASALDLPIVLLSKKRKKWNDLKIKYGRRIFYAEREDIHHIDKVLFVDDFIRSGSTYGASRELARKRDAEFLGGFVMFAIGDEWKKEVLPEEKFVYGVKVSEDVKLGRRKGRRPRRRPRALSPSNPCRPQSR